MKKPLALQLYSVRDLAKKDFPALLKKIAAIGYVGVEFAGFHDYDVHELSKITHDLELQPVGCHTPLPTVDNIAQISQDAAIMGYKTLLVGLAPDDMQTTEGINTCIEKLQSVVTLTKKQNLRIAMHNHWWEFDHLIDGKTPYEHFLQEVPKLLSELDVYWAAKAGAVSTEVLRAWSHRIPLIHVKDGDFNDNLVHLPVGRGKMNTREILKTYDPSVVEWLIVEIDNCDTDILDAVEESYRWLVDNGFGMGTT